MSTAFGIQRLVDANQRYFRANDSPVYLRVKNFQDNPIVEDLGFTFVPTKGAPPVGTTDILIAPPPSIANMSMHSIAMATLAGLQLRQGAKKILISQTWVLSRQKALNYNTPEQVFKDTSVVGIVSGNLLMEILSYTHQDVFGEPVTWIVICNSTELSTS